MVVSGHTSFHFLLIIDMNVLFVGLIVLHFSHVRVLHGKLYPSFVRMYALSGISNRSGFLSKSELLSHFNLTHVKCDRKKNTLKT